MPEERRLHVTIVVRNSSARPLSLRWPECRFRPIGKRNSEIVDIFQFPFHRVIIYYGLGVSLCIVLWIYSRREIYRRDILAIERPVV